MSIYRIKTSPFWQYDFQIKNTRFHGSTGERSRAKAQAVEAAERDAAKRLVVEISEAGRRPLTFEAAALRWWDEHGSELRDGKIRVPLDWLIAQIGPHKFLHDITDDDVSHLVGLRKRDRVRSGTDDKGKPLYRPITARTINTTVPSLMRRIFRRARDNWSVVLLKEPTWGKHFLRETKRPIREITQAEEQRLDTVEDSDFADLRRFAIITGIRRAALLLTWPQVDFDARLFRIIKKGGEWQEIPMTDDVYAMLWARRGQDKVHVWTFVARRTRRCPHHGTMQYKGTRYPITYHGLGSRKQVDWAKAGVDARIHDMRHTTGSRMARKTGNLKLVQTLLGHTDIKTTATFYAGISQTDLRQAMQDTSDANRPTPALPENVARLKPKDAG